MYPKADTHSSLTMYWQESPNTYWSFYNPSLLCPSPQCCHLDVPTSGCYDVSGYLVFPILKRLRILHSFSELVKRHQHLAVFSVLASRLHFLWSAEGPSMCSLLMVLLHGLTFRSSLYSSLAKPTLNLVIAKVNLQRTLSLYTLFPPQTGNKICKRSFQLEQGKELWREGTGFLQGQSSGKQPSSTRRCLGWVSMSLEIATEDFVRLVIFSKM